MTAQAQCPHCGTMNPIAEVEQWSRYHIVVCDNEAGGCDKPFAVRTLVSIETEVYTLTERRIEP